MPHIINSSNCIYIRNIHRNHKWYSLFCCLPVCFQRIIHRLGERALLHLPAAVTGIGRFEPMHADFFLILSTATVTEGFTLLAERYKGMPAVRSSQLKNLAIIFLLPRRPSPTIAQKTGGSTALCLCTASFTGFCYSVSKRLSPSDGSLILHLRL